MNVLKQTYKYIIITIGAVLFLASLFMTFQLDFIGKSGGGTYTDGFDNRKNPENGKAYWTVNYLGERAIQTLGFFAGIYILGYGFEMNKKENGTR